LLINVVSRKVLSPNSHIGISQAELAAKLAVSYVRINKLIHSKWGITPDTALRLEQFFGMEAQFWLNLQLAWDLYQLIHSTAAKQIRRIKRLPALEARAAR
jgi:addiction module HigA family antidote